ncbi:MAG: PIG-L family deacetylase [Propionibacteriaceae bacterium]|jgi:N-acetyl-1-D-myo-inositol-2-amino-2-deoxy-alpha-D-glucopyranoside deacetylase|nr:PIG-L family deacetylase [Propionibacteriaceae bacterium]
MNEIPQPLPKRVVCLHAHPDDESLSTGTLIVELVARGCQVAVVTATRGERGETTPGFAGLEGTPDLSRRRAEELNRALHVLGVNDHAFLGWPPCRAAGLAPRVYEDSGMSWVTPDWAGPAPDASPESFWLSDRNEAAADLEAYLASWGAELVVTYNEDGGYGHPDHVACHEVAVLACRHVGLPLWTVGIPRLDQPGVEQSDPGPANPAEVAQTDAAARPGQAARPQGDDATGPSDGKAADANKALDAAARPGQAGSDHVSRPQADAAAPSGGGGGGGRGTPNGAAATPDAEPVLIDLPQHLPTVVKALGCHASQVVLDGTDMVHSGGQRHPIPSAFTLRTAVPA